MSQPAKAIRETLIKPPTEGNTLVAAVSTTTGTLDISSLAGRHITIQAQGCDLYYVLADSSATASATATSGDTRTAYIPAGGQDRFWYDADLRDDGDVAITDLEHITDAGSGFVRVWASDYVSSKG